MWSVLQFICNCQLGGTVFIREFTVTEKLNKIRKESLINMFKHDIFKTYLIYL